MTKAPFLLKGQLREYQHIGLDWLVTLYQKRLNGGRGFHLFISFINMARLIFPIIFPLARRIFPILTRLCEAQAGWSPCTKSGSTVGGGFLWLLPF